MSSGPITGITCEACISRNRFFHSLSSNLFIFQNTPEDIITGVWFSDLRQNIFIISSKRLDCKRNLRTTGIVSMNDIHKITA